MNGGSAQQSYWGEGGKAIHSSKPPTRERNGTAAKVEPPPPMAPSGVLGKQQEPIRLTDSSQEAKKFDDFADIYALIVATDRLEKVWRRDAVTDAEYEKECYGLIQKFKAARTATMRTLPNIERFYAEYNINAHGGRSVLVDNGVPSTQGVQRPDVQGQIVDNIHCIQFFISLIDNIELNQRTPESLLGWCVSLRRSLERIKRLEGNFPYLDKLKRWIDRLNSMGATEELSDADVGQFKLDLTTGYDEYLHIMKAL